MLFNSEIFLVFITAFFIFWPLMRRAKIRRWLYIVAASCIFYGWWDPRYLLLMVISGLIDYYAALGIVRFPQHKKILLCVSLAGNLGLLATFKYASFFAANLDYLVAYLDFAGRTSLAAQVPKFMLVVPVGISFYTFQSMSYTIDVFRGTLVPTRNVFHFFAYLSFFPQLVAGPIVRAADLLPSLLTWTAVNEERRFSGLCLIARGYFKKIVIADNLAPLVNAAFTTTTISESSTYWWAVITAFSFQIYCDFSGYSDIAIGLGQCIGYQFPKNFDRPYQATSLREFWSRWHISLSTWFRDYVYIPLGGSHRSAIRSQINLWVTLLLSGLWHGAAWTFVLWAVAHASFLTIEKLTNWPTHIKRLPLGHALAQILTLKQIWVAWVFFRANSVEQAFSIIKVMFFSPTAECATAIILTALTLFLWEILAIGNIVRAFWGKIKFSWLAPYAISVLLTLSVFLRGPAAQFIYFQF